MDPPLDVDHVYDLELIFYVCQCEVNMKVALNGGNLNDCIRVDKKCAIFISYFIQCSYA